MTCPLCQAHFEKEEMICSSACPLHGACKVVCCPHCHYSFVEDSTVVKIARRLSGAIRRTASKGNA